jgi:hypothetical protein
MFQVPMCANVAVKSSSPVETAGTTLTSAGTSRRFSGLFAAANAADPSIFGLSHRQPITLHLRPHESCGVKAAIGMLSQYSSNNQGTCLMNDDELPERITFCFFAGIFNSVVFLGFWGSLFPSPAAAYQFPSAGDATCAAHAECKLHSQGLLRLFC